MASIGFGLERLGYLTVKWPRLTLLFAFAFTLALLPGLGQVTSTGTLSAFFRSSNPHFLAYQEMSARFPSSEFDVFVIVEGNSLLTRDHLEDLRSLHLELQFAPAVTSVLSIFSMREAPDARGYAAPMFPAELPQGEAFAALKARALAHPLLNGKLLAAPPGEAPLTVLIVSLDRKVAAQEGLTTAVAAIEQTARSALRGTGLMVHFAGAPVMQKEMRDSIRRDRLIFNSGGFLVGFLIAFVFFQRFSLVLIASLCPLIGVLWALGALGYSGAELDSFVNVIPPLVMVIAFSDAMHMIFTIRRHVHNGDSRLEAVRGAITTTGPACALTSITTALAMLSLTYADSGLIRTFGVFAAFSTMMAFLAVIVLVPSLSVLLIGDEDKFRATEAARHRLLSRLDRFCVWLAGLVRARYGWLAGLALVLGTLFFALHLQLEPRYRLSDQVPRGDEALTGSQRLEQKLTGAQPVHIMIQWPEWLDMLSPEVLGAIAAAHRLMEAEAGGIAAREVGPATGAAGMSAEPLNAASTEPLGVGNVWSLHTLVRWLRQSGDQAMGFLRPYLKLLPHHLTGRFINENANAALVTGRIPNLDAAETVPIVERLDHALEHVRRDYPGFRFSVTGLPAVAALQANSMIRELNYGLLMAIVVVIAAIGLAFRSWRMAGFSILPNLFPLVAGGAVLFFLGRGLEYASVIALTISFGLAVDDTIHFLNRLHIERQRTDSLAKAVSQTLARIGPVLILTTVVLVLGLAVTVFSQVPPTELFGLVSMVTLFAALLGDLFLLPAIILIVGHMRGARERIEDNEELST